MQVLITGKEPGNELGKVAIPPSGPPKGTKVTQETECNLLVAVKPLLFLQSLLGNSSSITEGSTILNKLNETGGHQVMGLPISLGHKGEMIHPPGKINLDLPSIGNWYIKPLSHLLSKEVLGMEYLMATASALISGGNAL